MARAFSEHDRSPPRHSTLCGRVAPKASSVIMRSMPSDVQSLIQEGAELTDQALEELIPTTDVVPASIHGAMRHSTFAGGKRLRPVLVMQSAVTIAGSLPKGIARLGAAIEML